mmetsp:Transcript_10001/g.28022  ORF Transcript_10001/g.28022 Transcript_10001/m.28022 type:complete len:449 (-) Transcript_10001:304-1650(-)
MSDANAPEGGGAPAGEPGPPADAPMPYIDQLVVATGVELLAELDDDDDEEWLEEEWVEDLVEDDSESDEDDEEMYDSEECYSVDIDALCASATRTAPTQKKKGLSAEAKLDLTWRLDKDESYSDWTIEIITGSGDGDDGHGDGDEKASRSEYHVHKTTLATGRRKSQYFDGVFSSGMGQFQESESNTSKICLPTEMATAFPDFLDYMYAPFPGASCLLSNGNVWKLRSLASYFIVQSLTDATSAFIIEDMRNKDRMGKYLEVMFEREERELIANAVVVCASCIRVIYQRNDATILQMPPAFFLRIIIALQEAIKKMPDPTLLPDEVRLDAGRLCLRYYRKGYGLVANTYFHALEESLSFLTQDTNVSDHALAVEFLKTMHGSKNWNSFKASQLEHWCVRSISSFLSNNGPAGVEMNKRVTFCFIKGFIADISPRAAAQLMTDAFCKGR